MSGVGCDGEFVRCARLHLQPCTYWMVLGVNLAVSKLQYLACFIINFTLKDPMIDINSWSCYCIFHKFFKNSLFWVSAVCSFCCECSKPSLYVGCCLLCCLEKNIVFSSRATGNNRCLSHYDTMTLRPPPCKPAINHGLKAQQELTVDVRSGCPCSPSPILLFLFLSGSSLTGFIWIFYSLK